MQHVIHIKKEEKFENKMEYVNNTKSEPEHAAGRHGGSAPYAAGPRYVESAFHSSTFLLWASIHGRSRIMDITIPQLEICSC
jgi:hypothetical protein